HIGKNLEADPEYKRRIAVGIINPEEDKKALEIAETDPNPRAKYSVFAFLLGVAIVVLFGFAPSLRPEGVTMSQTIEMVMISDAALILFAGKADVAKAVNGNIFKAGLNAVIAIFGIAWMGSTFYL
ncbi:C4-dicarboxylate ABC transporter, partial [Veillonellaceae bacterium M2-8]|nr:C4-dicarboxylate ABC transporter [Veillonellaceae bacterium M2-8]